MKKTLLSLLTISFSVFHFYSAKAQITVSETNIVRQAENTPHNSNRVAYTRNAGAIDFTQGPGQPPAGCGSLRFSTPAGSDKAYLLNYEYEERTLASLTQLSYSTFQTAGISNQVVALNIKIDYNGSTEPGGEAVLIFEPVYNTAQGTITANTWQTWDAYNSGNARWWSAQPINGLCAFSCYATWNQIVANNPDAIILGGIGLNQGSGNPGLISSVDNFTVGFNNVSTTYNFEGAPGTIYYRDFDGDGYGNPNNTMIGCSATPPAGYTSNNTDCDDSNKNKQVMVCRNGRSLCIGTDQIKSTDQLGDCGAKTNPGILITNSGNTSSRTATAYPNPTTGQLNVQMPSIGSTEAEIIIMNANGSLVESRKTDASGQVEIFDLTGKAKGLYQLKLITTNEVINTKIIVQ